MSLIAFSAATRTQVCVLFKLAVIAIVFATPAHAGTYTVRACWAPNGPGDWHAWGPSLPRFSDVGSNCANPLSQGISQTFEAQPGRWNQGTAVGFAYRAPDGTVIDRIDALTFWGSGVAVFGGRDPWRPGLLDVTTGRMLVPNPERRADDLWIANRRWSVFSAPSLGAKHVAFAIFCSLSFCEFPPSGGEVPTFTVNAARDIVVTLRDDQPPALITIAVPPAGWQRQGSFPAEFAASDAVGIREMEILAGTKRIGYWNPKCYESATNTASSPCPSTATVRGVADVADLADGTNDIVVRTVDVAGNVSERRERLLVDHIAPQPPQGLRADAAAGWSAKNGFSVSWTNPPMSGTAPIAAVRYELCPSANLPYDDTGCVIGWREGSNIARLDDIEVPRNGSWRLRLALRDAAGNFDAGHLASLDVPLRLDTQAPEISLLALDPRDPTRLSVAVSDALSGLAGVELAVRRQGDRTWQVLGTETRHGLVSATIDDSALTAGEYVIRARATDVAGNAAETETLGTGERMLLRLPLRAATQVQVGEEQRVRVKGSRGKRPTYRKILVDRPKLAYGESIELKGRTADGAGNPNVDALVEVLERVDLPGMEWRQISSVRSNRSGAFVFRALPGPARFLRFRYRGTPTSQPSFTEVELQVRAAVSLSVDRRRVRNGQAVRFHGRLLGGPVPAAGKLLAIQALTSRGWRTFATPRAAAGNGRWEHKYRFTGTPYDATYKFRVVVPRESAYPYGKGASQTISVRVRGGS
ncbi:hypothetical protein OJ998_29700 [Solirubrobacter taibaiensis]|nr:hypothetical protein [Solirubrobacter taibaiensis]